jgi:hypothetical protein
MRVDWKAPSYHCTKKPNELPRQPDAVTSELGVIQFSTAVSRVGWKFCAGRQGRRRLNLDRAGVLLYQIVSTSK